ncbi:MAG: hypothetical protein LUQ71_01480 [Methanoregula sp.]|nr:hypothetical protein [Methanoregula sp.]
MTRGRPPGQALREAKTIAKRQGKLCENTQGRGILYDFAIHLALALIYVRIKRIRREARTIEDIIDACASDIARLRRIPPTAGLIRELWVRTPKGTWRFFALLDDRITEIPPESLPENFRVRQPLRENAPGPDRSSVTAGFPVQRERFICPFTMPAPEY